MVDEVRAKGPSPGPARLVTISVMGDVDAPWRSWIPVFDRWAATYDDDTRDPWLAYETAWRFVESALSFGLGTLDRRSIVDVGCGTGEFVRRLVRLGAIATGIEPSAGMRDAARLKVPGTTFLDGHLESIPLGDHTVDAAIATYVVSHLVPSDQPAALGELVRVVVDGGPIVVVDVPSVGVADLPRVAEVLRAGGRESQIEWYERGNGLDCEAWQAGLEASGRTVTTRSLGPLLVGLATRPVSHGNSVGRR
jgi:ubiquinone/menaquinone biosynthesis C-methylase UbiE